MSLYQALSEQENFKKNIFGIVTGIVTNNQDPEFLGRVKVTLKFREELNGKATETDWIPVATMITGGESGTYFIPGVNDAVIVAFIMGDVNRPVVIGSLWDSQKKPPVAENKDNLIRKIKTPAGNEITINDKKDEEKINIKTVKDTSLTMEEAQGNGKINIKTSGGMSIDMEDKKEITLKTSNGLTVKMDDAGQSIEIKAGANKITMNNQGINIEGQQINIKATSLQIKGTSLNVEGTVTNIKGSPLMLN